MIIPTTENLKTISDIRENILGILMDLEKNPEPKFVLYKSKPMAVLLSMDNYKKILEMIEDYEDAMEASEIIAAAKKDKLAKYYTQAEVYKMLGYKQK